MALWWKVICFGWFVGEKMLNQQPDRNRFLLNLAAVILLSLWFKQLSTKAVDNSVDWNWLDRLTT